MTPTFQVKADDKDITHSLMDRLTELSIQDNAGMHNDKLSLELDDRKVGDQWITLPPMGTQLDVSLGYADADNQDVPCPLTFMGRYTLDEIEIEFHNKGRTFTINGHAAAMDGPFKQVRTRSYHETNLGNIVEACAKRCKLEAKIEPGFESIYVSHIDQTEESDMAFLTRLYDVYGTIAKPTNGLLLFGSPEGLAMLQGKFDKVFIEEDEVLGYRYLFQTRGKFSKTKVNYYDTDEGDVKTKESGGPGSYAVFDLKTKTYSFKKGKAPIIDVPETPYGPPDEAEHSGASKTTYTSGTTASNPEDAQAEANSKKNSLDKAQASLHVEMIGDPLLESGGVIHLSHFRPEIPLKWHVTKVKHTYNSKGYITTFEADTNLAEGEKKDGEDDDDPKEKPRPNPLIDVEEDPYGPPWHAEQTTTSKPPVYNDRTGGATSLTSPDPVSITPQPPPQGGGNGGNGE